MAAPEDAGRAPRTVADATHDLYRQYGKQIYAYCLHQLRSREEAEDAVQTTFLNAFRGLQRGTTTRFEQAWLYKIAENVCIARRSSSGRRLKLEAPDDFEILEEVVPAGNTPAEGDTLELMGLDAALDSMPENQRRAILMREWQGLSYREIAAELGLSQGAVEMLIFRARRGLALALEQPDVADKRRTGKAKTGFSFGSLIAAMKSLLSGGAVVKMAAVAVSATVVGTHAIHSIVQPVRVTQRHAHRTALAASPSRGTSARVVSASSTRLVAHRTPRTHPAAAMAAATPGAPAEASGSSSGHAPVIVMDVAPPEVAAAEPAPSASDTPAPDGSPSATAAVAAPQATSSSSPPQPTAPAAAPTPPNGDGSAGNDGGKDDGAAGHASGKGHGSKGKPSDSASPIGRGHASDPPMTLYGPVVPQAGTTTVGVTPPPAPPTTTPTTTATTTTTEVSTTTPTTTTTTTTTTATTTTTTPTETTADGGDPSGGGHSDHRSGGGGNSGNGDGGAGRGGNGNGGGHGGGHR